MKAWSATRCGEAVHALSSSATAGDSGLRSVVRWCPGPVGLVDRVVRMSAPPGLVEGRDRAEPGRLKSIRRTANRAHCWVGAITRSRNARDASSQAAFSLRCDRRESCSSTTSRRRADKQLAPRRDLPALQPRRSRPMKTLLQIIANLFVRSRTPSIEEQYLAQAVDAQDLQVRLLALERARP